MAVATSDNVGESWTLAKVACAGGQASRLCNTSASVFTEHITESVVAELPGAPAGRVLLSSRVDGQHIRRAALSIDSGASFSEPAAPAGMLLADAIGDMGGLAAVGSALFYSMALSESHDRSHMTVLQSDDGGGHFTKGALVYPGPAAYSDLVALEQRQLGLAYERDCAKNEDGWTDCVGESCSIWWTQLPADLPAFVPPPQL